MIGGPFVLFDTGPSGRGDLFSAPRRLIRADHAAELSAAFDAMEDARRAGLWLAGFCAYETGYALQPRLAPLMPAGAGPLLIFGAFDGPQPAPPLSGAAQIGAARPLVAQAGYNAAVARVHDYIAAGDSYQINLTFPMRAEAHGGAEAIYASLRGGQPVGDGALVCLGGPVILSRSPELFFQINGQTITTRPMKGTAPRHADPVRDAAQAAALAASEKDRAENLMIVDLLRNDLSQLCRPGTVRVPALFAVERYRTVHQMTSTVTGELTAPPDLTTLFQALFPCGSVTGAPKIRSMQIIAELEGALGCGPRGVYCGAIGWVAPGGDMRFSVAIRTPVIEDGGLTLRVGGGITHDSRAGAEWEEALCKAAFLTA